MYMPNKWEKYLRWAIVAAELLLTLWAEGPWLPVLFLLANTLIWGLSSVP